MLKPLGVISYTINKKMKKKNENSDKLHPTSEFRISFL